MQLLPGNMMEMAMTIWVVAITNCALVENIYDCLSRQTAALCTPTAKKLSLGGVGLLLVFAMPRSIVLFGLESYIKIDEYDFSPGALVACGLIYSGHIMITAGVVTLVTDVPRAITVPRWMRCGLLACVLACLLALVVVNVPHGAGGRSI